MKTTQYAGIDYSHGLANRDAATDIHYGVISQNSVMPEALSDFYDDGEDLAWKEALAAAIADAGEDADEDAIADELGQCWEQSASNLLYEYDGYKLTGCLDNDLFVLKSPYYTRAQFCSPCVPGAGNLDNPCEDGPRTYCLGHDWFENGVAPYQVFSVATNELVNP